MLGTQARLLSGLLLDKVGPPMVHGISLVLTVCTHTILWQMPNYPDFVGVEYVLYTSALLGGKLFIAEGNMDQGACLSKGHFYHPTESEIRNIFMRVLYPSNGKLHSS